MNTACRLCLCQARYCTRLARFSQAHASCLKHFGFLRVKVPNTVPCDEVRLVDVLLSTLLRYQLIRLHTFLWYQLIRIHTFFLNLWNVNIGDLIRSSRFSGTYGVYQIQQLKHRLCMLLYHATANHRYRHDTAANHRSCRHADANHRSFCHATANHRSCEVYTQVRQSHGFTLR